jgi:uncharacterized protein (TIGR02266 family)
MEAGVPPLIKPELPQRQYRRVVLVTEVECEALERKEVMVTRDVSAGGMFITARYPLPIDSYLTVNFRIRLKDAPMTCRARVRYTQAGVGMGIQFLDLSDEARDKLQQFVDEIA